MNTDQEQRELVNGGGNSVSETDAAIEERKKEQQRRNEWLKEKMSVSYWSMRMVERL